MLGQHVVGQVGGRLAPLPDNWLMVWVVGGGLASVSAQASQKARPESARRERSGRGSSESGSPLLLTRSDPGTQLPTGLGWAPRGPVAPEGEALERHGGCRSRANRKEGVGGQSFERSASLLARLLVGLVVTVR